MIVEEVVAGRRGEAGITTLAVQAFTDALEDGFHDLFLLWFAVRRRLAFVGEKVLTRGRAITLFTVLTVQAFADVLDDVFHGGTP